MKPFLMILALSLVAATLPGAQARAPAAVVEEEHDYAAREAGSPELASFEGGWHGVVLLIALLCVISLVFWCCHCHYEPPPPPRPSP